VLLGLALWRQLQLDEFFEARVDAAPADVPWSRVAAVLAIDRLCAPGSGLAIEERWYPMTALDDLLHIPEGTINDSRLYRTLDHLPPHKAALERHLTTRYGELFAAEFDVLLYDLTSSYVEGAAPKNPMMRRGYSRDHRPDCLQVILAVIVNVDGFPLSYETFDGNRADVTTLETVMRLVERKYGQARRVWVFDRGIVSDANLAAIRRRGGQYLVGTRRTALRHVERALLEGEEQEHRPARGLEHSRDRLRSRRRRHRGRAKFGDTRVARELSRDVDPRRFAPRLRVPGIAHEYRHLGSGHRGQAGAAHEIGDACVSGDGIAVSGQVVERRQRVRLAAAELGDERQDRRGVVRAPRQAAEDHPRMLAKGTGQARAREELHRGPIVLGRRTRDDLLQRDRELIGVERAALANLTAQRGDSVPGLHAPTPSSPLGLLVVQWEIDALRRHLHNTAVAPDDDGHVELPMFEDDTPMSSCHRPVERRPIAKNRRGITPLRLSHGRHPFLSASGRGIGEVWPWNTSWLALPYSSSSFTGVDTRSSMRCAG
jgi:hypothetical protein